MAFASARHLFLPAVCLQAVLLFFLLPSAGGTSSIISSPQSAVRDRPTGLFFAATVPKRDNFVFEEPLPSGVPVSPASPKNNCLTAEEMPQKPLIAIIIDDMGYHQRIGQALLELDLNLTFSFLPYAPYTPEQAEAARQKGRDVLVHMPMEARDPAFDPGPGTLYLKDSPTKRAASITANLAMVPQAIGVNNHMGSRFTADRTAMDHLLTHIQQKGLFFIDSITTSDSVAMETARQLGIKTAGRDIFLDNIESEDEICREIGLLVDRARKRGRAIAIGHPGQATLKALEHCRQMLLSRARIVNIHELVR